MIEGFSPLEERVYKRFCRAFVNLPIDFRADLYLSPQEEEEAWRARSDARSMCQEMERDEGDLSLSLQQMNVLSMMAICDAAELLSVYELAFDGRNFDD
jgi:hypothetical protein